MPAAKVAGIFLLTHGLMISVANDSHNSLLLRNANLVLPDRVLAGGAIAIEAGRIARVFDSGSGPEVDNDAIDVGGLTIFPGFIDFHIHGAVGVDVNNASAHDLLRVSKFLATKGVTGWLPTLVPASHDEYARAIASISAVIKQQHAKVIASGARVLGVHYEGP